MMVKSFILLVASYALLYLQSASAHSWVSCTDYRIDSRRDEIFYNPQKCHGFGRYGAKQKSVKFGVDTGYDFRPTSNDQCQPPKGQQTYTTSAPMATYTPGQRVCLAFPAKNHVGHDCNNPYIKDQGLWIRRSKVGETVTPKKNQWEKEYAHANVDGTVHKGFMNCPNFCNDNDKALCTACFTLEPDLAAGNYIFQWFWEFNKGEFYSTCYDVSVSGGSGTVPTPAPTTPTPTSPSPVTTTPSVAPTPSASAC